MPEQERFPKFIGRENIIEAVENFSKLPEEASRVCVLYGVGGIGKTTILLKLREQFISRPDLLLSSIIDFSQLINRTKISIMNQISKISHLDFNTYREALDEFHEFEIKGQVEQPGLRLHSYQRVEEAFLKNLKTINTNGFKGILFFDTCEQIFHSSLMDFLLKIATENSEILLIMAGRPPKINHNQKVEDFFIRKFIEHGLNRRNYQILHLEGFKENETDEYFNQSADGKTIDPEMRKKIQLLTNGNPIKIALSIEWLRRGIDISDVTEYSFAELEEISKKHPTRYNEISENFEFDLVDKIRVLQSPVDDILLKMAHVQLRFNSELLNRLIQNNIKATIMGELKSLPFIKFIPDEDFFVLHDEFARLLNDYIWQRRDSTGLSRKNLNIEVLKYYDEKIEELTKKYDVYPTYENDLELKSYEIERIYYQLGVDFIGGFKDFDTIFEDVRTKRQEDLADLAVQVIKRYPGQLTPLADIMLNSYYQGWVAVCRNDIDSAIRMASKGKTDLEQLLQIKYKDKSKVDELLREHIADVYNLLGFCQRRRGAWKEAIDNYEKTLNEFKKQLPKKGEIDRNNPELRNLLLKISETLNNIANVRRFQGNLDEARHLCQISLVIRENWGNALLQGKSAYVLGMILWELGGTAEAMKYLHLARELFSKSEGSELFLGWVDRYEGYIHYRIGFPDDALEYLQNAYTIFLDLNEEDNLAEVCNDLARIYSDLSKGNFVEADKYVERALEYSKRTNNEYLTTQCYLTMANRFFNEYHKTQSVQLLKKVKENIQSGLKISSNRYPLFESIFVDLTGQVAAIEKKYLQAMEAFMKACELCLKFKVAFVERAFDRLDNYLINLAAENSTEALICCDYGLKYWTERGLEQRQEQLIKNLNDIKTTINNFEERKKLDEAYHKNMNACQWEQATKVCDDIVKLGVFSRDDFFAKILYNRAAALRNMEKRSEARRVCKTSISIFKDLKMYKEEGDAHYLLGNIFWELGNTAEASQEIKLAKENYENASYDPGKGYIARFLGHVYSRMGSFEKYNKYLNDALVNFKKFAQHADLADIYNIISRVARAELIEGTALEISFKKAKDYAELALDEAKKSNDQYRMAEAYLTLSITYYSFRDLFSEKTSEFLKMSKDYLEDGKQYIAKNKIMLSIAIGIQGNLLYAKEKYDEAIIKYLYDECKLSVETKHMRLPRALELLTEKLLALPIEKTNEVCDKLINKWKKEEFYETKPDLETVCKLVKEYRPFIFEVKPKDKMIKT